MKKCKLCGIEKGIDMFPKNRAKCKICYHKERTIYEKKKREENQEYKEKRKKIHKKYNDEKRIIDVEKRKEYLKEYHKNNKIKRKKYNEDNKVKINEYRKNYSNSRRKSDSLYRLRYSLSNLARYAFKGNGFKKKSKTEILIGCSFVFIKKYIENKFESWMNWDNYGKYNGELNYGWDIDHIICLSSAKTEDEIIKLCHYTNLQPLCSKINRDIKINKL